MTQQAAPRPPSSSSLYLRRQRQQRKFTFDKFMYRHLYRKLRQWENSFILHHNPLDDPDSSYLSFANPNYCYEDQMNWNAGDHSATEDDDDDSLSLDKLSVTDPTAGHSHRAAHSDYSSAEMTPSSPTNPSPFPLPKRRHLHHPSNDDTDDVDTSSLDEDDDDEDNESVEMMRQSGLSCKSEVEEGEGGVSGGNPPGGAEVRRGGRGILDYLTMLEREAQDKHCSADNATGPGMDWRAKGLGASTPEGGISHGHLMNRDDNALHALGKLEDGSYINSPDSNDSGIHSDARSDDGGTPHSRPPAGDDPCPPGGLKKGVPPRTPDTLDTPDTPDSVYEEVEVIREDEEEGENGGENSALPPGWQRHEDDQSLSLECRLTALEDSK
ncbi:hypothetical protein ACOMHN_007527 [Nucella lapillus]